MQTSLRIAMYVNFTWWRKWNSLGILYDCKIFWRMYANVPNELSQVTFAFAIICCLHVLQIHLREDYSLMHNTMHLGNLENVTQVSRWTNEASVRQTENNIMSIRTRSRGAQFTTSTEWKLHWAMNFVQNSHGMKLQLSTSLV